VTLYGVLGGGRWRPVYALAFTLLAAAAIAAWDADDWRPAEVVGLLTVTTLAFGALSRRFDDKWGLRAMAGDVMPIGLAAVLLGPLPACVMGASTVLIDSLLQRARPEHVAGNVLNFGVYPLVLGIAAEAWIEPLGGIAYVAGVFVLLLAGEALNFGLTVVHAHLVGSFRVREMLTTGFSRIGAWSAVMALVVASVAYGYREGGFGVLALMVVGLVVCEWLLLRIEAVDHALRAERDLHESYLRMVGTIVVSIDADLRINFANRKAVEALGLGEDPVGADWAELTAVGAVSVERHRYERLLAGEGADRPFETVLRRRGDERAIEWHVTVLRDARGAPATLLLSGEDVTEQRDATRRMAYLAYNDALTGLPNRASFDEQLPAGLAQADECGSAVALLFMDCDGFKRVNDRHGYETGDRLLAEAAGRLRAVTGVDDLLVRRGGDEFLMLIPDLGVHAADAVAARRAVGAVADRIARAFDAPFPVASTTAKIAITVGAAIYPLDACDAAGLERAADAAMYELKPRPLGERA
jgi:diguanylate cyclase (GGDEF)-like protein/PAS domain S-box-containing protein